MRNACIFPDGCAAHSLRFHHAFRCAWTGGTAALSLRIRSRIRYTFDGAGSADRLSAGLRFRCAFHCAFAFALYKGLVSYPLFPFSTPFQIAPQLRPTRPLAARTYSSLFEDRRSVFPGKLEFLRMNFDCHSNFIPSHFAPQRPALTYCVLIQFPPIFQPVIPSQSPPSTPNLERLGISWDAPATTWDNLGITWVATRRGGDFAPFPLTPDVTAP